MALKSLSVDKSKAPMLKSLAVKAKIAPPSADSEPSRPKEVRIKQAENGYIVSYYDNGAESWMGSEKQHVASDIDEAMKCVEDYMGDESDED